MGQSFWTLKQINSLCFFKHKWYAISLREQRLLILVMFCFLANTYSCSIELLPVLKVNTALLFQDYFGQLLWNKMQIIKKNDVKKESTSQEITQSLSSHKNELKLMMGKHLITFNRKNIQNSWQRVQISWPAGQTFSFYIFPRFHQVLFFSLQ